MASSIRSLVSYEAELSSFCPKPNIFQLQTISFSYLKFLFNFWERGKGREKEMERNINVWFPVTDPLLGIWPATQACALTENWTGDLLVHRLALNPLSQTSQETFSYFYSKWRNLTFLVCPFYGPNLPPVPLAISAVFFSRSSSVPFCLCRGIVDGEIPRICTWASLTFEFSSQCWHLAPSLPPCLPDFLKYSLNLYYMPGTVLGDRDTEINNIYALQSRSS